VSFETSPAAYQRFMGRFSEPLAGPFADVAGVRAGQRALDVGCGTGALTGELVSRLGATSVAAVDPSRSFEAAARERFPDADVRRATAEALPFPDEGFDVALAQLVVHFMADPVKGLAEMGRVVRAGGTVAASVWDHAGGSGPLALFWDGVRDLDPGHAGETDLPGTSAGQLARIATAAGLGDVRESSLQVTVTMPTFDDWWEPFTFGVGPAGAYVADLDERHRDRLRHACRSRVTTEPFDVTARAWCVVATA
jgi:SAM-dependent methyltransferase